MVGGGLPTLEREVLRRDLCCGCGACLLVCRNKAFYQRDDGLIEVVAGYDRSLCGNCALCAQVCPSMGLGLQSAVAGWRADDNSLGGVCVQRPMQTLAMYSTDKNIRQNAASGGAVTAILVHGLDTGAFEAAIVVGREKERPWFPHPVLTSDVNTVIDCAQSTYSVCASLAALSSCCSKQVRRVAFVGLACHMQALRKAERYRSSLPWLPEITLTLELACSSNTLVTGTTSLLTDLFRLTLGQVRDVKYREGEYPGSFWVRTKQGQEFRIPFWQSVTHFQDFKPWRCRLCQDWMSGLADLSFADGSDDPLTLSRIGGTGDRKSCVFVWSRRGKEILRSACESGSLQSQPTIFHTNAGLERKKKRFDEAVIEWPLRQDPTLPTTQTRSRNA